MRNLFYGLNIKNCGTAISMPSGGSGDTFIKTNIEDCETGLLYRDPPSLLASLGLPPDTPPQYLIEALEILQAHEKEPENVRAEKIKSSKIGPFLQGAANVAAVIALALSPEAAPVLALLKAALAPTAG